MNNFFSLLLLFALTLSIHDQAPAKSRPKGNIKLAFSHTSGASVGKTNRAWFHHEALRPVIDLNPHTPQKFKTAKAGRHYKFAKGH